MKARTRATDSALQSALFHHSRSNTEPLCTPAPVIRTVWLHNPKPIPTGNFRPGRPFEKGLVSKLVAAEDVLGEARDIARDIAERAAPVSVTMMRQMAWRMLGADHPMEAHRIESKGILYAGQGRDAAEGVTSFLEKRAPDFPGRLATDTPPWYPFWDPEDEEYGPEPLALTETED